MVQNEMVEKPKRKVLSGGDPSIESIYPKYISIDGNINKFQISGENLDKPQLRVAILRNSAHDTVKKKISWDEIFYSSEEKPSKGYDIYLYDPSPPEIAPEKFPFYTNVHKAIEAIDHLIVVTTKGPEDKITAYVTADASPYAPDGMAKVFGNLEVVFKPPE